MRSCNMKTEINTEKISRSLDNLLHSLADEWWFSQQMLLHLEMATTKIPTNVSRACGSYETNAFEKACELITENNYK